MGAKQVVLHLAVRLVITVDLAGCKCIRCCNLPVSASPDIVDIEVDETEDTDSASDGTDDDLEQEVDEIMMKIFGDCDWADTTQTQRVTVTLPAMAV